MPAVAPPSAAPVAAIPASPRMAPAGGEPSAAEATALAENARLRQQLQAAKLEQVEQAEAANRKCKETETEIYNLRSSISDYEGKLRSKESMFDDHNYLQSQLNQ